MGTKRKLEPLVTIKEGGGEEIDYGIYAKRSFTGDLTDAEVVPRDPLGQLEYLARQIAKKKKPGNDEIEQTADAATGVIQRFLARGPSQQAARDFLDGNDFGRLWERLNVLPHQRAALRGKRQAKRIDRLNDKRRDAGITRKKERHKAVAAEIKAQQKRGERQNYEAACKVVAKAQGLEDHKVVKLDVPNEWTRRR